MADSSGDRKYDLEDRTFVFARDCRAFVRCLPRTDANIEDGRQLIRSSGSVGANYIEANESLSRKDFVMRAKICRKEAKESVYWLRLLDMCERPELETQRDALIREGQELTRIFSAIIKNAADPR